MSAARRDPASVKPATIASNSAAAAMKPHTAWRQSRCMVKAVCAAGLFEVAFLMRAPSNMRLLRVLLAESIVK
jgi:hypothetical protein